MGGGRSRKQDTLLTVSAIFTDAAQPPTAGEAPDAAPGPGAGAVIPLWKVLEPQGITAVLWMGARFPALGSWGWGWHLRRGRSTHRSEGAGAGRTLPR